ncbi:MAG: putative tRNA pseudouridine synthase D [Candidatus Heimdallarchaeota archaeon AB_125]|nr:MAG: putative tRNA pseudouridine synthase D [Candidatus Heimdallarchaeota archaeon AB_125]
MNSDSLLVPTITKSERVIGHIKHQSEDFIVCEKIDENHILDPRIETYNLPGKKGLFLHFVLIKNNIDTSVALDWISNLWKVERNDLSIAGTKDKRAFTAQRVSLWGVKRRYEEGNLKEITLPKIKTKSFCFRIKDIRLGDLWGNAFDITIRRIPTEATIIQSSLETKIREINDFGYLLNSFGQQRFGKIRPITHLVGEKLLLGEVREALKIYVGKSYGTESQEALDARKLYWETENPQDVLKIIPDQMHIEKKILKYLQKHKNYERVFLSLPLQFQKLFIHAYQAYIFNKYLKIRYNEYSKNLCEPLFGEKIIDNVSYAPLIGNKTELTGQSKEIYSKILENEEVSLHDFNRSLAVKLGSRGSYRALGMKAHNLLINDIAEDELNPGKFKVNLSFELRKGSYATEVLKEILSQG